MCGICVGCVGGRDRVGMCVCCYVHVSVYVFVHENTHTPSHEKHPPIPIPVMYSSSVEPISSGAEGSEAASGTLGSSGSIFGLYTINTRPSASHTVRRRWWAGVLGGSVMVVRKGVAGSRGGVEVEKRVVVVVMLRRVTCMRGRVWVCVHDVCKHNILSCTTQRQLFTYTQPNTHTLVVVCFLVTATPSVHVFSSSLTVRLTAASRLACLAGPIFCMGYLFVCM